MIPSTLPTKQPQRALKAKQEAFCQYVAKGNSLSDSYRRSYNALKMKDSSIHRKASELHTLACVRDRIVELAKKEEEATIANRTECLQISTRIARGSEKDSDRLKAVEILSRMQGFDAPSTSVSLNLSLRRSPDEMREILRRQVDFTDLELFKNSPASVQEKA